MLKFTILLVCSAIWVEAAQVRAPLQLIKKKNLEAAPKSDLVGKADLLDGALLVDVDIALPDKLNAPSTVKLSLDSMTDQIWVIGQTCNSTFCKRVPDSQKLPAGKSPTKVRVAHDLVEGLNSTYSINIANVGSGEFPVVAATSVSSSFNNILSEQSVGVLGLRSDFFRDILKPEGILSIKASGKDSGLYNGIPKDLLVDGRDQRPVSIFSRSTSQWKIGINYISNSRGDWSTWCTLGCAAVLDTTFSGISGPPSEIDSINSYLGVDENGEINCDKVNYLEPLVFHIGQRSYKIDPKNVFMEPDSPFTSKCKSAFVGERTYNNLWRIGLPMFKQYLTVFDFNDNCVSFLSLKENITPGY